MILVLKLLVVTLVVLAGLVPGAPAAAADQFRQEINISTPKFSIDAEGVTAPGYVQNDVPGAPVLPVYGTVIELPTIGAWTLDAATTGSRLLPQRLNIPPVASVLPSSPDPLGLSPGHRGYQPVPYSRQPDPTIYGRDAFYPATVAMTAGEQWQNGKRLLAVRVFPFQYNPVARELLYHPHVRVTVRVTSPGGGPHTANAILLDPMGHSAAPNAGELGALRLRTDRRGLYRLTQSDLANAGLDVSQADPDTFLVTYLGQPIRIQVTGAEDGSFDPGDLVIFYAEPYVGRWMASNVYRFSFGALPAAPSTRITTRTAQPSGLEPVVTTISQTLHLEQDRVYYSDYWIDTEADHIFDNPLNPSGSTKVVTRTYDLPLDDPLSVGQMQVSGLLYGGQDQAASPDEWAKMRINGHDLDTYTWDGRRPYTITASLGQMSWLDQPANKLHLVADLNQLPSLTQYWYNPDWLDVTYPAAADAEGDHIEIEGIDVADTAVDLRVTGFSSPAVRVFDVRDPRNPVQLLTTAAAPVNGGTQIEFWDAWTAGDPPPAYSLATDAALLVPVVEADQPSQWRSPDRVADYIAIVHRSLWNAIDPLLNLRASQGLRVAKVDVQDVYDEFNYGQLHQRAIYDFLAYAYANWNAGGPRPKYAVLVGDATFDFKGVFSWTTMKVLVPTFLGNFDPWMAETASDNRFATLDGPDDRLPEIIVGRIPAQTPEQVTDYVNKVLAYEDQNVTPDGAWQNQVAYVADDDENAAGNFHAMSDDIRVNWLPSYYTNTTVYYNPNNAPPGGYTSASGMKSGIKQAFDTGQVFMQWFGHASKYRWGSVSGIWNTFDPANLNSNTRLPFVAAFSCLEGYFINIDTNLAYSMVLAEQHLLQQGRGSVGGLSPSGKHIGSALSILDQGLTKSFFQDRIKPTGDGVDAARLYYFANASAWLDVLDTSILFGDPALKLRLPLPPPVPPVVAIAAGAANAVDLTWSHVEPDTSYQVWRGTAPYFDSSLEGVQVGSVDALAGGYGIGATVLFSDNGALPAPPVTVLGYPNTNYFWIVRGANWRGVSAESNRAGEFDFALVPGGVP